MSIVVIGSINTDLIIQEYRTFKPHIAGILQVLKYRKNKRYIANIPHILNVVFGQQLRLIHCEV